MSTAYVALPNIQGNLSAAPDQVGWVITAFVVATAVGTILTNVLSERFGRRQVFLASIVGFTVTALLAGTSSSLAELVLFRMLQGFVSAPLNAYFAGYNVGYISTGKARFCHEHLVDGNDPRACRGTNGGRYTNRVL